MEKDNDWTYDLIRTGAIKWYAVKTGNKIGEAACLETLAEECSELAQAALKKARKIRGENPTPKSMEKINENLIEEVSDVQTCLYMLCLHEDLDIMQSKLDRCNERLKEKETKPCPFCGGKAEIIFREFDSPEDYSFSVECSQCGAEGEIFDKEHYNYLLKDELKELAINAWNNRK